MAPALLLQKARGHLVQAALHARCPSSHALRVRCKTHCQYYTQPAACMIACCGLAPTMGTPPKQILQPHRVSGGPTGWPCCRCAAALLLLLLPLPPMTSCVTKASSAALTWSGTSSWGQCPACSSCTRTLWHSASICAAMAAVNRGSSERGRVQEHRIGNAFCGAAHPVRFCSLNPTATAPLLRPPHKYKYKHT